jgi:glycosyltransferase involved in cell wall biosynthesis
MRRIHESILMPAVIESRVIPTGVNLEVFRPKEKSAARAALGLPQNQRIVVFASNGVRRNTWKDYQTLREAFARVAEHFRGEELIFMALGESSPTEHIGSATIRFVPHQKNPEVVAQYYQAADLYVHAARADTFPRVVLEALACGTPVVATAVGGIPEAVRSMNTAYSAQTDTHATHEVTGVLTPPGDAVAMASAMVGLSNDGNLRCRLSENAVRDARNRFDLQLQVRRYLDLYRDVLARHSASDEIA